MSGLARENLPDMPRKHKRLPSYDDASEHDDFVVYGGAKRTKSAPVSRVTVNDETSLVGSPACTATAAAAAPSAIPAAEKRVLSPEERQRVLIEARRRRHASVGVSPTYYEAANAPIKKVDGLEGAVSEQVKIYLKRHGHPPDQLLVARWMSNYTNAWYATRRMYHRRQKRVRTALADAETRAEIAKAEAAAKKLAEEKRGLLTVAPNFAKSLRARAASAPDRIAKFEGAIDDARLVREWAGATRRFLDVTHDEGKRAARLIDAGDAGVLQFAAMIRDRVSAVKVPAEVLRAVARLASVAPVASCGWGGVHLFRAGTVDAVNVAEISLLGDSESLETSVKNAVVEQAYLRHFTVEQLRAFSEAESRARGETTHERTVRWLNHIEYSLAQINAMRHILHNARALRARTTAVAAVEPANAGTGSSALSIVEAAGCVLGTMRSAVTRLLGKQDCLMVDTHEDDVPAEIEEHTFAAFINGLSAINRREELSMKAGPLIEGRLHMAKRAYAGPRDVRGSCSMVFELEMPNTIGLLGYFACARRVVRYEIRFYRQKPILGEDGKIVPRFETRLACDAVTGGAYDADEWVMIDRIVVDEAFGSSTAWQQTSIVTTEFLCKAVADARTAVDVRAYTREILKAHSRQKSVSYGTQTAMIEFVADALFVELGGESGGVPAESVLPASATAGISSASTRASSNSRMRLWAYGCAVLVLALTLGWSLMTDHTTPRRSLSSPKWLPSSNASRFDTGRTVVAYSPPLLQRSVVSAPTSDGPTLPHWAILLLMLSGSLLWCFLGCRVTLTRASRVGPRVALTAKLVSKSSGASSGPNQNSKKATSEQTPSSSSKPTVSPASVQGPLTPTPT